MDTCVFRELFESTVFLSALAAALGCGRCRGRQRAPEALQSCQRHAAQFDSATTLLAAHCPCPVHRGDPRGRITRTMVEVRTLLRDGAGANPVSVRRLGYALGDTATDRAFSRLRLVFPVWSDDRLRCAFSERPRRWARKRAVAERIAPSVLEQEALAALVLAAGYGHPAADLPEERPDRTARSSGDPHGFDAASGTVPVTDLAGRVLDRPVHTPRMSVPTADYLLHKLAQLAGGMDTGTARTADEHRRARLARELVGVDAAELARRLDGVLRRLAQELPTHSMLLDQARGRVRSAPYHPADSAVRPTPKWSPHETAWLRRTASALAHSVTEAVREGVEPTAAVDRALTALLTAPDVRIPARWRDAPHDREVRADLLEALADIAACRPADSGDCGGRAA